MYNNCAIVNHHHTHLHADMCVIKIKTWILQTCVLLKKKTCGHVWKIILRISILQDTYSWCFIKAGKCVVDVLLELHNAVSHLAPWWWFFLLTGADVFEAVYDIRQQITIIVQFQITLLFRQKEKTAQDTTRVSQFTLANKSPEHLHAWWLLI